MIETNFIISQILMLTAMFFDFFSMQFKSRKQIFSILAISATLISLHYLLLNKKLAALIISFSILRFIVCIFTTNKKILFIFLGINITILLFNITSYKEFLLIGGLSIFIIGNFQQNKRKMRIKMMTGTSLVIIYNIIIFTPAGILTETVFLIGQLKGYFKNKNKTT